jgi:omega-hydroxy-beta-dihydromenaquinone-9 sulfotransferase
LAAHTFTTSNITVKFNFKERKPEQFFTHPMVGASLYGWFKLLSENNFRIDIKSIPQVIYITVSVLFFTPYRWIDRAVNWRKRQTAKVVAPVFIIGHPRSGTTYLHYLMAQDSQFAFCKLYQGLTPELFMTFGTGIRWMVGKAAPKKRPMDNLKLDVDLPVEEEFSLACLNGASFAGGFFFPQHLPEYLHRYVTFKRGTQYKKRWQDAHHALLIRLQAFSGNKQLLLKSPANAARIEAIIERYPDAKFIYIHRNPIEVFSSSLKLYESILPALSFQKIDEPQLLEFILNKYEGIQRAYLDQRSLVPAGNLVSVSYNELQANNINCLKTIYAQLNLPGFELALPKFVEMSLEYSNYEKNDFNPTPEMRKLIEERWGFAFEELGYQLSKLAS